MADIYEEFQGIASELLTEFRQGAVVLVVPGEDQPGAEPWLPPVPGDPVEHLLNATVKGVSDDQVDGDLIKRGDLIATVAGDVSPLPVAVEHHLKIDGTVYQIFKVETIPAAGVPVAIKVFVRR